MEKLLLILTPEKIADGSFSKVFPRRVRLSDGVIRIAITIGIPISKSKD